MLEEARKRDLAANAVLGLAFAASAAQSSKDFVRTGNSESSGVAMMQRTIGNPRRKPKDLDKPAVMSRGTKLKEGKTFEEFVKEAYLIEARTTHRDTIGHEEYDKWRNAVADHYATHGHVRGISKRTFDGVEYEMRNKAGKEKPKTWAASKTSDRKASAKQRRQSLRPISYDEFLSHAKRNLIPNPKEVAAAAADFERQGIRRKRKEAKTKTKETGEQHDLDHLQPQPTKRTPELQPRFQAVLPGHSNANMGVMTHSYNTAKQDKPPKKGEPGWNLTRAGAVKASIEGGKSAVNAKKAEEQRKDK